MKALAIELLIILYSTSIYRLYHVPIRVSGENYWIYMKFYVYWEYFGIKKKKEKKSK